MTAEELLAGVVIPVDKPKQWTSFQAVNKVKSILRHTYGLKKLKIGHAGTLDPMASGLLLVCVGAATKQIMQLQQGEKEYTGTMVLGATTPCYDTEQAIDRYYPFSHITQELIDDTRRQFIGDIQQVPPMYSAVKVNGHRAYEYARIDDPTATIEPRTVSVTEFDITRFQPSDPATEAGYLDGVNTQETSDAMTDKQPDNQALPKYHTPKCDIPKGLPLAEFHVTCGKGTYIRSIARDYGQALGSGAYLADLRRTRIGGYTVDKAVAPGDVMTFLQ